MCLALVFDIRFTIVLARSSVEHDTEPPILPASMRDCLLFRAYLISTSTALRTRVVVTGVHSLPNLLSLHFV